MGRRIQFDGTKESAEFPDASINLLSFVFISIFTIVLMLFFFLRGDWFSVLAYRPDTTRIFVDIGLGFHAEFTWSEALNYISLREEKISRWAFLSKLSVGCFCTIMVDTVCLG